MGVKEIMSNAESLRTISSVHCSHTVEGLGKMHMDKSDFSVAGTSKYKRRKVSAVRDFPSGCGRYAPTINLRANEDAACDGNVDNSVVGSKFESQLFSLSLTVAPTEVLNSTNDLEFKGSKLGAPSDQMNGHKLMKVELEERVADGLHDEGLNELLEVVKCENPGLLKDSNKMDAAAVQELVPPSNLNLCSPPDQTSDIPNGNDVEKKLNKIYPPRRRVSAIRDFPPFCGRGAPPCKEKSQIVITSLGQEKSGSKDEPLKETIKSHAKETGEDMKDRDSSRSTYEGHVSRLVGSKVQAHSEGQVATTKNRKQAEFTISSEIKTTKYHKKEKKIKTSHEIDNSNKSVACKKSINDLGSLEGNVGKEIVVYREDKSLKRKLSYLSEKLDDLHEEESEGSELRSDVVVVLGLMAAPNCPWMQGKGAHTPSPGGFTSEGKGKRHELIQQEKSKSSLKKKKKGAKVDGGKLVKNNSLTTKQIDDPGSGQMVVWNNEESCEDNEELENFGVAPRSRGFDVNLPPFGNSSSSGKDNDYDTVVTRNKVRETLRLFQAVCRKLLQEEEAKPKERGNIHKRIDLQAAKILKEKEKYISTGKQTLGCVPGVEVGDEFHYRVELAMIGLHRLLQGGIDYMKLGGNIIATSVVASGGYADDLDNSDFLIYTGSGGNVMGGDKNPEDQKLERGNLALKNSIEAKNPVRVIRGFRETKASDSSDSKAKTMLMTYTYDGLYLVEKFWQEVGPHGKLVYRYLLGRIPGQPELAWKEVTNSKKCKVREGLCVNDISDGKEKIPISAVNIVDDEKPAPFNYITGVIYPDWCRPIPPKGCDCTKGCSDSEKCSCAVKNGGEIPYNYNGAIVEAKPIVYECGPSCNCPPSCPNRVSQRGIKYQLEIFKTVSRGWGVRSLTSIPSGNFICEYVGELLEDTEAERRTGNDEYLFDIGNTYSDNSLWDGLSTLIPDAQLSCCEVVEEVGFTIDAAEYGNVGRFINHSCSPNLYAQNVLYDHEDKRIPHIMFFAAENIPPLQELTYHYNYTIDQVHDCMGNIKKKSCYCGSSECIGRMY